MVLFCEVNHAVETASGSDFQLSLAIGKEGQNARLAARLTGWKIDIKSESQMEELAAAEGGEPAAVKSEEIYE